MNAQVFIKNKIQKNECYSDQIVKHVKHINFITSFFKLI